MLNIRKIHHVAYRCLDAKQTVEWYRKHLDMEFVLAIAEERARTVRQTDFQQTTAQVLQQGKNNTGVACRRDRAVQGHRIVRIVHFVVSCKG